MKQIGKHLEIGATWYSESHCIHYPMIFDILDIGSYVKTSQVWFPSERILTLYIDSVAGKYVNMTSPLTPSCHHHPQNLTALVVFSCIYYKPDRKWENMNPKIVYCYPKWITKHIHKPQCHEGLFILVNLKY